MRKHWRVPSLVAAAMIVGVLHHFQSLAEGGVQPIPVTLPGERKPEVRAFMQAKLTNAQHVLEGLLTTDFAKIRKASATLRDMALNGPEIIPRQELDDRVYEHFRTEFTRLSGNLERMAAEENLEGAAFVHQNLTSTCIACHQHIRDEWKQVDGGAGTSD